MRSKYTLTANIIITAYFLILLSLFICAMIPNPEPEHVAGPHTLQAFVGFLKYFSMHTEEIIAGILIVFFVITGFIVHSVLIVISTILGWIGYITKKTGFITASAIANIVATLSAIYVFPITVTACVLGFIGAKKQKQLNNTDNAKAFN